MIFLHRPHKNKLPYMPRRVSVNSSCPFCLLSILVTPSIEHGSVNEVHGKDWDANTVEMVEEALHHSVPARNTLVFIHVHAYNKEHWWDTFWICWWMLTKLFEAHHVNHDLPSLVFQLEEHITGPSPPVRLVRFSPDHFFSMVIVFIQWRIIINSYF